MRGIDLKLKRVKKGIRAGVVAKFLNISNSYCSYMESDQKPIPIELLSKWIRFLEEN